MTASSAWMASAKSIPTRVWGLRAAGNLRCRNLQCLAQCNADIYAGATTRQTAQSINAGTLENLTICMGEDDWYQIEIDAPTTLKVTVAGQGDPIQNDIQLELWSIDQDFDVVNDESRPPSLYDVLQSEAC